MRVKYATIIVRSMDESIAFYSDGRLKATGATITMGPVRILVGSLEFDQDPNGARIALVEHRREIARPSA